MRNQMRQNRLTGQWVIYAPQRSSRPSQHETDAPTGDHPRVVEDCPFCPGNEDALPEIILSVGDGTQWQTRVVPNKYPMLTPDQSQTRQQDGLYVSMAGYGHHEVIIEHPRHDLDLADFSDQAMHAVIETYHQRYRALMELNETMMVIIFRNHGERAGTSLKHPHSQLVVTGVVPRHVRWREDIAERYYDTWGRSLMGDILAHECDVGDRLVDINAAFVACVPYAAEVPYEMWIIPRRQQADFGAIGADEKYGLAVMLQGCLKRLRRVIDTPDYNYIIHTAARYKAGEPHLHWYLQIRPRSVTSAGFEIGSGMLVNPSLPEEDAQRLREVAL